MKNVSLPRWEHFEHIADIGVRGLAEDKSEAFEQTALALISVISPLETVEPIDAIDIECEAPDDELLLVDWLNALVYEMAVHGMLFSRFEVTIDGRRLRATAWGESIDVDRHHPAVEVKGATYTQLHVAFEEGAWVAQCVVDV